MFKYACFLLLLTIALSSCQKLLDYYNYRDAEPSPACRVKAISNEDDFYLSTIRIQYHNNGLPAVLESDDYDKEFDFTTSYTRQYTYDHLNRLISDHSENAYVGPRVYYAYEGNSLLPVRDTVVALYVSYVEDLEYDAKGRITKVTARDFDFVIPEDNPGPHPDQVTQYYYDLRGNRQEHPSNAGYNGLIEYSDKPSLYSLHPVWQLLHKNYSRNSVPFGETFNEEGLPLTIKDELVPHFQPFLKRLGRGSSIEYDCGE